MSYCVFFSMSVGLAKPHTVPKGTLLACQRHVAKVEAVLGLKAEKYLDNPAHWPSFRPSKEIKDEVLCETVRTHNRWVRWLYDRLAEWAHKPPTGETEELTPADAQTFWHGLEELEVPFDRWTSDYYRDRMEHAYEVLRGRESEGATFDEKALTPRQAAAVIRVFSEWMDKGDVRLDVPKGCDYLASSADGGYDWCERRGCGPMHPDDAARCRKRKCPLREDE